MKKKLAILLTVLMVLTAVAPSFAATIIIDQPPVGQDAALDELIMLGVLKEKRGDDYLKRQDTVVLLSRLMGQEEQAKAYPINHPFNDVTDSFYNGYLGWAYANQYFMGKSGTEFGFGEFMTVQQLQIVLLRSLGYYLGEFPGWDVVASTAGTLGFGTNTTGTALASRGNMATFTAATIRANYKGTNETLAARLGHEVKTKAENGQLAIHEFRQVGPKTFELECDEAIDMLQSNISVKRGSITASIKEITFPTYGKEMARIEMNSNIVDADYTAQIVDVKGQMLSETIHGERPYLAQILITSSTAKLKGFTGSDANKVVIGYETLDQFDNEISASVSWSGSGNVTDKGSYLEVYSSTAWQLGQAVMITGIAQITGQAPAVVNRTLTVSEPRKAVTLQLGDLENIDEDPQDQYLVQGSSDVWVMPVYAYDQDGDLIKDVDYFGQKNSTTSNNVILSPADGKVVWYYPSASQVADGKEEKVYIRIYANMVPESTVPTAMYINLVDKNSGANESAQIELMPNGVNKIMIDQPDDYIVAGNPIEFPFEAFNYVGDKVTKYDSLKNSIYVNGVKMTKGEKNGFYWVEEPNGDANIMYLNENTSYTTQFMDYATFMANSSSPYQVNFTVYPASTPYAITGLDEDFYEYYAVDDGQFTIDENSLLFEDQYGYEYNKSIPSGFDIQFSGEGVQSGNSSVLIELDTPRTYTFYATLYDGTQIIDERSFDVTILESDDIDNFEVTQIGKLYAPSVGIYSEYGKTVEVIGKEGNKAVKLPSDVITNVSAITATSYVAVHVNGNTYTVYANSDGGALTNDITAQLLVQYNIGGVTEIEQQTVVLSPEAPKAVEVKVKGAPDAALSGSTVRVELSEVTSGGMNLVLDQAYDEYDDFDQFFPAFFEAKDQYDLYSRKVINYMYVSDNGKYTINNTNYAYTLSANGAASGDTFTVVAVTAIGTIQFNVIVD